MAEWYDFWFDAGWCRFDALTAWLRPGCTSRFSFDCGSILLGEINAYLWTQPYYYCGLEPGRLGEAETVHSCIGNYGPCSTFNVQCLLMPHRPSFNNSLFIAHSITTTRNRTRETTSLSRIWLNPDEWIEYSQYEGDLCSTLLIHLTGRVFRLFGPEYWEEHDLKILCGVFVLS